MNQPHAFITGIAGQDGCYLTERLIAHGYSVWGVTQEPVSSDSLIHQIQASAPDLVHLHVADIRDEFAIAAILRDVAPTEIYHLAAQSHVGHSISNPAETLVTNGLAVVHLLELIRTLSPDARFFQASSSEIFGSSDSGTPNELSPLSPQNPYAAAKVYAQHMTRFYRETHGLFACCGILFNHESPRRGANFVTRKITQSAAAISVGRQEFLELGNLHAQRDWGFAGDYVEAMRLMLQKESPQDYVIATGQLHSVRDFCEQAFSHAGLPLCWDGTGLDEVGICQAGIVRVKINPAFYRPTETQGLCGDAGKAARELGWTPRHSFKDVVRMMVDADLDRARS